MLYFSAKFIHSRPIIQVSSSDDDDKSRQHRYRMLIFPGKTHVPDIWKIIILFSVLRLINTLQSSLSDRILNLQILQFVITHQGNDLFLQRTYSHSFHKSLVEIRMLGSPVSVRSMGPCCRIVRFNSKINHKRRTLDTTGYDIQ